MTWNFIKKFWSRTKMSYLLDKKIKQKKFLRILFCVIVLFVLTYFRSGIGSGLSYLTHIVFRPVLVLGNNIGEKFGNFTSYFISKSSLHKENDDLKSRLAEDEARMANYNSISAENESLKGIFGRKSERVDLVLAAILAKPNQTLYDTLILHIGTAQNIKMGNMVFAFTHVPIGRVAAVYSNSSKVVLFSTAGEKTQVVLGGRKDIFMQIVGRGGGNFEMTIPRDLTLNKGDEVVLPGITPYILAVVETVISDPRDPLVKALLVSPVNMEELKFVEVELK